MLPETSPSCTKTIYYYYLFCEGDYHKGHDAGLPSLGTYCQTLLPYAITEGYTLASLVLKTHANIKVISKILPL